jgi:ATP adenylyltransferase
VSGVPDGLERLWTPHRLAYVSGSAVSGDLDVPAGCPFCRAQLSSDVDGLVIARGASVFAVLNLYPYNPGHLMTLPYRHVADYTDLDEAETIELAQFTRTAMRVVRQVSSPHGFNLGMNQGAVAGAGIAAHLHQHVVPRWGGDTNFMPIIGRTKTVPQLLADTRRLLADAWADTAPPASSRRPAAPKPARRPNAAPVPVARVSRTPAKAPAKAPAKVAATTLAAARSTPTQSASAKSTPAKSTPAKRAPAKPTAPKHSAANPR